MRADRIVRLMLLLQSRKGCTVPRLARELQVSERTVHRDLDALSSSGVPVFATRGAKGGVSLMDGWKTQLTGFTRPELQSLAAIGPAGALEDLGLSGPLRNALVKLAASLPSLQQPALEYARQRLHVDASSWFGPRERVPWLAVLRDAAWQNRSVSLEYRDFEGRASRRVVNPLGLVVKAERWYLVAGTDEGPRVFRGSRIGRVRLLETTFARPGGFNLPGFWAEWGKRFSEKRASYEVHLKLSREAEKALREIRPPADQARLDDARKSHQRSVTIDFERESIAVSQLCTLPEGVEVLAPESLRQRLLALGIRLRALYSRTPLSPAAPRARRARRSP